MELFGYLAEGFEEGVFFVGIEFVVWFAGTMAVVDVEFGLGCFCPVEDCVPDFGRKVIYRAARL